MEVATVLTVYGIETKEYLLPSPRSFAVATVLTVYGIETWVIEYGRPDEIKVATVLTVYGIETHPRLVVPMITKMLQQYLPFTVLKLNYEAVQL